MIFAMPLIEREGGLRSMQINVKMTNTKIGDKANVMSGMRASKLDNVNVVMDGVEISNEARFLDDLTDAQADEILQQLKEQGKLLEKTSQEYCRIQELLNDMQTGGCSAREVLVRHLPNLLSSTLANIIGNVVAP